MSKEFICKACGSIGKPKTMVKGSVLVEIFLWFAFLLPGIIYSIWRSSSRYKACSKCGAKGELVPVDSPIGQKLLADYQTANIKK